MSDILLYTTNILPFILSNVNLWLCIAFDNYSVCLNSIWIHPYDPVRIQSTNEIYFGYYFFSVVLQLPVRFTYACEEILIVDNIEKTHNSG